MAKKDRNKKKGKSKKDRKQENLAAIQAEAHVENCSCTECIAASSNHAAVDAEWDHDSLQVDDSIRTALSHIRLRLHQATMADDPEMQLRYAIEAGNCSAVVLSVVGRVRELMLSIQPPFKSSGMNPEQPAKQQSNSQESPDGDQQERTDSRSEQE